MWSLITSLLVILETRNYAMAGDLCPLPDLTGNAYEIVDTSPNKATVKITISPHTNTNNGWSTMLIFGTPLAADIQVSSYSVQISAISDDRKALTVESRNHNTDISKRRKYSFTLIFEGTDLDTQFDYFPALVGFYPELIGDGSCFLRPDVIITLPTTTSSSTTSSTTTTSPVTTTTSTTTSAATTTTSTTTNPDTTTTSTTTSPATTTTSTTITSPPVTQDLDFSITNPGWNNGGSWYFQFGYETPIGNYNDWTIKIVFSEEVVEITPYEADPDGPHSDGLVWFLTPKTWNNDISNGKVYGTATAITTADSAPCALAIFYNNNDTPDPSVVSIPGCGSPVTPSTTTSTTTTTTTTTTTSTASTSTGSTSTISTASTSSTTASTLSPDGPTGILPDSSSQTIPDFTPSPEFVSGQSSFDYNEILHKSILFYEAQRSGPLPADNRIPWRGDSGLKDGCVGGTCFVDLTGGWYDAGDFVKFGFPMAWSTTVLAWGMLEFEAAYQDAGEWNNAISMLKWATDYFLKAHTSQNELYFQVGDPDADHSSWGHPETMTMERPIYKIDTNNPGSEVAAETAAAMAASSLIFRSSDNAYADILLAHARDLYFFAQVYKGNYHETVPSSKVANFYRSFSGYRDELMWAAMWLYKATDEQTFLNDAISEFDAVGTSEFSWDQKGPGALVLLAQEDSQYKLKLDNALDSIMAKTRTPGGLTYFSEWGTNRYAANYALIALATAKMEGLETTEGAEHFGYGEEQIGKLLGEGDGSRSYVVGYGVNPPQRPHHRSSSCRSWSPTTSNECDWNDYNANGANPQILYGALVGGPEQDGSYTDDRGNFRTNEVAVDYNAGFQSAIAALKYFEVMARS